jgi:hypothetical protein
MVADRKIRSWKGSEKWHGNEKAATECRQSLETDDGLGHTASFGQLRGRICATVGEVRWIGEGWVAPVVHASLLTAA